jgi:[methyl-Co(III) methanol-specific corrinoid protein]:coenzyme M methyltransferase
MHLRIRQDTKKNSKTASRLPKMSKCRALEILDGQMEGPPVLSSPLVNSTVYQMKHSGAFYPRAHQEAEKMARLAESIYTLFGFKGMRVPFDLCVEAEALGCKIKMGGEPPFPYLAKSLESSLEPFPLSADLFQQGRFPVVFRSLKYLQEKYKNRIPLYAGCTAPFTLGGYLWEAEKFLTLPIQEPQRLKAILDWLVTLVGDYAKKLLAAGANVIVLIDPTASANMISPRVFERFILPVYFRLKEIIQGRIILHICGDTNTILRFIRQTQFAGFSFEGPSVTVKAVQEAIGGKMALIGNIPTWDSLMLDNPFRVKEDAQRALSEGINLLAPACSIPPETSPENLLAMREAWEDYLLQAY